MGSIMGSQNMMDLDYGSSISVHHIYQPCPTFEQGRPAQTLHSPSFSSLICVHRDHASVTTYLLLLQQAFWKNRNIKRMLRCQIMVDLNTGMSTRIEDFAYENEIIYSGKDLAMHHEPKNGCSPTPAFPVQPATRCTQSQVACRASDLSGLLAFSNFECSR
jgi:hypothetical protein